MGDEAAARIRANQEADEAAEARAEAEQAQLDANNAAGNDRVRREQEAQLEASLPEEQRRARERERLWREQNPGTGPPTAVPASSALFGAWTPWYALKDPTGATFPGVDIAYAFGAESGRQLLRWQLRNRTSHALRLAYRLKGACATPCGSGQLAYQIELAPGEERPGGQTGFIKIFEARVTRISEAGFQGGQPAHATQASAATADADPLGLPAFTITIDRGAPSGDAIVGQLMVNGNAVGATLERKGVEIKAGEYAGTLMWYRSPAGYVQGPFGTMGTKGDFLIEVEGVGTRTQLLLHGGNAPKNSKGCVLLGAVTKDEQGRRFIKDQTTLRKLRRIFYKSDVPDSTPAVRIVIIIRDAAVGAPAENYESGGKYDACVSEFYDPKGYNWLSYRNGCAETLKVVFVSNDGVAFGASITLKAGGADSTGYTESEVRAKRGFSKAICRDGWLPVDGQDRMWGKAKAQYRCKLQPR